MNVGDWAEIGQLTLDPLSGWTAGQCQRQKQTGNKSGQGINVTNKAQLAVDPLDLKKYFQNYFIN